MIERDCDGKINIIMRDTCKNDAVYYEKIFTLRLLYDKKYKHVVVRIPKSNINHSNNNNNKDINTYLSDD